MNTVCFSIGPGATAQPLHRDDWCYHVVARKVEVYPEDLQRDVGVGLFVAGKKATRENGCTRFIPGSHLWEHEREPEDELCAFAELEKGWYFSFFFCFSPFFFSFFLSLSLSFAHGLILPGDGFIMLASCYHGGGANTTTDEERLLYSCFMTRGWLRQEENHYLNMGLDKVKTLPREIQDICGYALSEPFLGWVNSTTPRVVLDPSIQVSRILRIYIYI